MSRHVKTLGILGGGQLGRMSALAAAQLGISVIILTPEENAPASQVALDTLVADYTDKEALQKFADRVDVITYEFENIPLETVEWWWKAQLHAGFKISKGIDYLVVFLNK